VNELDKLIGFLDRFGGFLDRLRLSEFLENLARCLVKFTWVPMATLSFRIMRIKKPDTYQ
jgi:hypothetical protein